MRLGAAPMGRRHALVGVAAALTLVVSVVSWATATDQGSTRVHTGTGGPRDYSRYLRLDEGRAGTVAVSAGERVEVWWQRPGEREWSAPQVVEGGPGRYLVDTSVRVAGTTVAIRALYNTHAPWDEYDEPGVATSVFIVCRSGSCAASEHYTQVQEPPCEQGSCVLSRPQSHGVTQVPELTPDGEQVFFGATERGYAVWTVAGGLRELDPEGVPGGGVVGAPMLAPDGSFRLVSGRARSDTCELTLLTSPAMEPADSAVSYTVQVSTEAPTDTSSCATTLEAFTPGQLLIHTDRDRPTYLVRSGGSWAATEEDPTGMVRYRRTPGRRAAGSAVRAGYWHWREVVIGSPDGRSLVAQVHFPGAARWTDPVTVAVAPPGLRCFEIAPTSTPAQEPFYVSLRCRSRSSPGASLTYVGAHALTEDGLTWDSALGDQLPTRVGDDLFFGGAPALRWTPDGGLGEVGPPVRDKSRTFQLDDGTVVMVSAEPRGPRCRLVVRVAEPGDARWSAPIPNPDPYLPNGDPCRPVGQYDGRSVGLYYFSDRGEWVPARVERVDGAWVVTPRRRAG